MSKKSALQNVLNALLALMIALLSAIFGLCAYIFVNFEQLSNAKIAIASLALLVLVFTALYILKAYAKRIKKMEKMK